MSIRRLIFATFAWTVELGNLDKELEFNDV